MNNKPISPIAAFVEKNQQLLSNLYYRWQDEKEYEDIKDYGARIEKEFPEGWKLVQTTKRPFGFKIAITANGNTTNVHLTVGARQIAWKRC